MILLTSLKHDFLTAPSSQPSPRQSFRLIAQECRAEGLMQLEITHPLLHLQQLKSLKTYLLEPVELPSFINVILLGSKPPLPTDVACDAEFLVIVCNTGQSPHDRAHAH